MRLIAILLFAACLQVSAAGNAQTVSVSVNHAPLEKVFREIKKQTGYKFFYEGKILSDANKVSISVKNVSVEEVLNLCFKNQPLTYTIIEKTVVVKKKEVFKLNDSIGNMLNTVKTPPPIDIKGRIIDQNGKPVVVAVMVKGTNKGTTTNDNGEFELRGVDEHATLVITGVSIESFEVRVDGRTELALNANTKTTVGEEVIINKGYYSTSRKLNTGNVSKIASGEIEKQPVPNPLQAIQGRVAGLEIVQQNGLPGGNFNVRIRGTNSIANGNNPLFIIDGTPFTSNTLSNPVTSQSIYREGTSPLNVINPTDIESIEVLKDADATAIYGSRGSNGVILITTKKGKAGKPRLDINFYTGAGTIASKVRLLNTQQYIEMREEALANTGVTPRPSDYDINGTWDRNRYTDWQDVFIGGTANITDAQASLSGGEKNTQFFIGAGYHRETTVFPGDYADKRISTHFRLNNTAFNDRLKTSFSINYSVGNNNMISSDLTSFALQLAPNAPALYNSDGSLNWANSTWFNPLAYLTTNLDAQTTTLIGNMVIAYQLTRGFELKSSFGYTNTRSDAITTKPKRGNDPAYFQYATDLSTFSNGSFKNWTVEPQLSYQQNLGKGKMEVLAGVSFLGQEASSFGQYAYGFANEALMKDIKAATTIFVGNNAFSEYRYQALFGRINYNWDKKYIVNLTGRRDGSSRFGPGKRFANLGAIGAAWLFAEEAFMKKNLPFISFGKLRASYGITGNDQLADYAFLDTYSSSTAYGGQPGLNPVRLFNDDFSWETNKKLEIGLELGLLNDQILTSVSWYQNRSSNQLVGYPLPPTTGFTTIQGNFPATVQNKGWEIELGGTIIQKHSFTWSSNFNISIPRNTLLDFPNLNQSPSYASRFVIGEPLSIVKQYQYIDVDPQTGLYRFVDRNGDGIISGLDRTLVKNIAQQYFGGWSHSFQYKGFSLDMFLHFVKQNGRASYVNFAAPGSPLNNQPAYVLNRWEKPGDITDIQKFSTSADAYSALGRWVESDKSIVDASFVRLKNVALSYDLPESLVHKWRIAHARLLIQGQNLLTFMKYKMGDPENQLGFGRGVPPLRVITAGINLGF